MHGFEDEHELTSCCWAGLFTRYFCHAEMTAAREADLEIVGVMEEDARHGRPNFDEERRRALTGGENGGPVHPQAEENIKLLDQVCFIPRRTQEHEVRAMVNEINRQGLMPLRRGFSARGSSGARASFRHSLSQSLLTEISVDDGSRAMTADAPAPVRILLFCLLSQICLSLSSA